MSKQLAPQEGVQITDFFENLARETNFPPLIPEEITRNNSIHQISGPLEAMVNPDSCLNKKQAWYVKLLIQTATFNFEEGDSVDLIALPIATFINTTRLDCTNCLTKNCKHRDPATKSEIQIK